jgi:hypothetical protein
MLINIIIAGAILGASVAVIVEIFKQFKTKHYESKTNIIRCITNYSLLGSIFYNIIFFVINYGNK